MKIFSFFENNGMLKIIAAVILIILSVFMHNIWPESDVPLIPFFMGAAYIILAMTIFIIAGIINTLKDFKK